MSTYRVSAYDPPDEPEESGWRVVAEGLSLWQIRGPIRELFAQGYDWDLSILVEREG